MSDLDPRERAEAAASTSHEEGAAVLNLSGELDLSTIHSVRETADALIGENPDRLVIDLTHVTFMDSSGIALLLWIATRLPQTTLRNPSPIIRQVIEMTGLAETLSIER